MTAAGLKELRKEIKKLLAHADERIVRIIYAVLKADAEYEQEEYVLTPQQEAILANRMDKYKKGLMKFSTWAEVEKRIDSKRLIYHAS